MPTRSARSTIETSRAYQIVRYGHESADSLLEAFRKVKQDRIGRATDEEQDILRAIVVFAGACLDSSVKQLFRDCLPKLVAGDSVARKEFAKYTERRLRSTEAEVGLDTRFLSEALTSAEPLAYLAEAYVFHLTGGSLQSAEQLFRACKALGLDPQSQIGLSERKLQRIFEARNQMVHEMDIDFKQPRGNRFQRRIGDSVDMANALLAASQRIVEITYERLIHGQ